MKIHNNKKGFSLLELIFALAILVIGLVGVLALFPVGLKASKRSGDFTKATIAAQQVMETIKWAGYGVYRNDGGPNGDGWYRPSSSWTRPPGYTYSNGVDDGKGVELPGGFSWAAAVTNLTGISNLRQVTVSVYWLDGGDYKQENFTTYLANYN